MAHAARLVRQTLLRSVNTEKESRLEKLKDSAANVEAFIEKAKRYTEISKLTPEILRLRRLVNNLSL